MISLGLYGSEVEEKIGSLKTIIIYIFSGFGGSIISMMSYNAIYYNSNINHYSVGASGAIFGIIVASGILQAKEQGTNPAFALFGGIIYGGATFFVGVDIFGHIGGAVIGGIVTYVVTFGYWIPKKESKICIVISIILICIICCLGMFGKIIFENFGFENVYIKQVKDSTITGMGGITYRQAMDEYYKSGEWICFESDKGSTVVEYKTEKESIQFVLYPETNTFEPSCYSLDNKGKTQEDLENKIYEVFTTYARNHNIVTDWNEYVCEKYKYVKFVRYGYPENVKNVNYKEALEEFLENPIWKYFKSTNNEDIVEINGSGVYNNIHRDITMQFKIISESQFMATYLSYDGESQTDLELNTFINTVFQAYALKHNIDIGLSAPYSSQNVYEEYDIYDSSNNCDDYEEFDNTDNYDEYYNSSDGYESFDNYNIKPLEEPEQVFDEYINAFIAAVNENDFSGLNYCMDTGSPFYEDQIDLAIDYNNRGIWEELISYEITNVDYLDANHNYFAYVTTNEKYNVHYSDGSSRIVEQSFTYQCTYYDGAGWLVSGIS